MAIFKKKISPADAAYAFFDLMKHGISHLKGLFSDEETIELEKEGDFLDLLMEQVHLTLFAVQEGSAGALGNSEEQRAVVQAFFALVLKECVKDGLEEDFLNQHQIRAALYGEALDKHAKKISDSIGFLFARFCGGEEVNMFLMAHGDASFLDMLESIDSFFGKYRVTK